MLETTSDGQTFPHRLLWAIVEEQAELANEREREWSKPALVAMVFAFHTVEAYLNFVGERLDPTIWADEQNFFKKPPYRGWEGKLRKVMELVNLPVPDQVTRPLKTVFELKKLRDSIAHAKPENLADKIIHNEDTEPPVPVSTLRSMFTPKGKLTIVVHDVEQFVNQIHNAAAPKVNDVWFGTEALRGPNTYCLRTTKCIAPEGA